MTATLNIFGLNFHLYGLLLGLAILAAFQASLWLAKRRGIEVKLIEKLFFFVVIGGIIGARIYHVVDKWGEIYSLNPQSAFYVWNGGLGIWGAVIGGTITASIWYLVVNRKRVIPAKAGIYIDGSPIRSGMTGKVSFLQLLDVVFFGLPLGQAIGRWGNFFNQELFGWPTNWPWGIHIALNNRPEKFIDYSYFQPAFLYESILNLSLFLLLLFLVRKKTRPAGFLAAAYLVGYGLIRFIMEFIRIDQTAMLGIFRWPQVFSLIVCLFGLGWLYFLARKKV